MLADSKIDLASFLGHYKGYRSGAFINTSHRFEQQVRTLFDGTMVKRFHTMPMVQENTVGQHSHGVAMLCWLIAGAPSATLLMAALSHDLAEQYVGDVPSPSKKALGVGKALGDIEDSLLATVGMSFEVSEEEAIILKLADCFDGMLTCARERMLGNRSKMVAHAYMAYTGYVDTAMVASKGVLSTDMWYRAAMVWAAVNELWEEQK